ncbi:MAG: TraM recognition domain-containing protein [Phycisphaerales bacterium]|nr:TraM recognition domain-containing protein [Phycisphaerales bacterium]
MNTRPETGPREHSSLLQNLDREPHEDILGAPGSNYDIYKYSWPFTVIRRQPLVFSPRSTARPNFGLLPDVPLMAGMELAFRHMPFRESDLVLNSGKRVGAFFLLALSVAAVTVIYGRLFPLAWVPQTAVGLTLTAVIVLMLTRQGTARSFILAFFLPAFGLLSLKLLALLFAYRIVGAAVFAVASAIALLRWGSVPFDFYLKWLYTHPRLRPCTRRMVPTAVGPDAKLLAAVLAAVVVGPLVSTTLTIAGLAIAAVVMLKEEGWKPWEASRAAVRMLTPFLTYGGPDAYAPGVWHAPIAYRGRLRLTITMLVLFFFATATGLTLFMPLSDIIKWKMLFPGHGPRPTVGSIILEQTEWWMPYAYSRITSFREDLYLWAFPIAIAVGALLPPLLLAAIFRKSLKHVDQERRLVEGADGRAGLDDDGRPEWQWYVDRLKDSTHMANGPLGEPVREADHLFLGIEPHARFPVLLHEKLLAEHAYLVGDSGSGKTSLGLMPLLIQMIRGHAGKNGARTDSPPIVIIDLKGDPALFHTAKIEAEARGVEFRFFTPEKNRTSHYFNPFLSLNAENRSEIQLCQILLEALSLNHGEGYGRAYYSRQSRAHLLAALSGRVPASAKAGVAPTSNVPGSINELYDAINRVKDADPNAYHDTLELVSTIQALTHYPMLASKSNPDRPEESIHMPSVLDRGQVVYFWLPAAMESVSVREIGKLALYSLLTACIDRQRTRPPSEWRQAYVFIDEFQRIAGENFRIILEQARSYGLGMVLANQTIADLRTAETDLRATVRTNTRFKRYFSVTDPQEVQSICDASGEELMYLRNWKQKAGAPYTEYVATAYEERSDSQSIKSRMIRNDVLAASDHPLDSIVHVSRGSGYTQFAGLPIQVRCTWPLSKATYSQRQSLPWPTRDEYPDGTTTTSDKGPLDIERERSEEVSLRFGQKLKDLAERQALFTSAQSKNANNA